LSWGPSEGHQRRRGDDEFHALDREIVWALRNEKYDRSAQMLLHLLRHAQAHGFSPVLSDLIDHQAREIRGKAMPHTLLIDVMSKREIEDHRFVEPCLVISVNEPDVRDARIFGGKLVEEVLRLRFHDEDNGVCNNCGRPSAEAPGMSDDHGTEVIEFVERHLQKRIDALKPVEPLPEGQATAMFPYFPQESLGRLRVVIHCTAGMCRSPGIASALAAIYNGDDQFWWDTKFPSLIARHRTILAWRRKHYRGAHPIAF
jgi:hypothetical protein